MTKADHNPLRAALERFGRERGRAQPRASHTYVAVAYVDADGIEHSAYRLCLVCGLHRNHYLHEQGQPQPRLYRTVDEEREFREAKEKYGIKDHWPQGQPQSSTAASPDEVERRRRADSTAIEQGQSQQEPAQSNAEPWIRHRFVTDPEICLECGQLRSFHPDQHEPAECTASSG